MLEREQITQIKLTVCAVSIQNFRKVNFYKESFVSKEAAYTQYRIFVDFGGAVFLMVEVYLPWWLWLKNKKQKNFSTR